MNEQQIAYDCLIAADSRIERKGKTMPYTSVNGHMFSFLDKQGNMGLRLSQDDRENFMKKHNSELMEQHGRLMKEYVKVPDALLMDTEALLEFLSASHDYVSSLKPKPTKSKK